MSGKILCKKLDASTSNAAHTLGSMIRGITIYNDGSNDVQVDFDKAVDGDSYLIPSGGSLSISADFQELNYKATASTSTLYVVFIQNP